MPQTIVILNQKKGRRKSKLNQLIDKYTDRLNTLKENLSEEMEQTNITDERLNAYNTDIRTTAKFITDLKTLLPKKKEE